MPNFRNNLGEKPIVAEIDRLLGYPFRWSMTCENCSKPYEGRNRIPETGMKLYRDEILRGSSDADCRRVMWDYLAQDRYYTTVFCSPCSHDTRVRRRKDVYGFPKWTPPVK